METNHDALSDEEFLTAIKNGDTKSVGNYLLASRNLNREMQLGETFTSPIHLACDTGQLTVLQMLLAAQADVNFTDPNGVTPLFLASIRGYELLVDCLIAAGAQLNAQVIPGCTPLYMAAQHGHHKVVELLIKAGVSVDLQLVNGVAPVFAAAQNGHHKVVELLIRAQANLDIQQSRGASPLHIAAQAGHSRVVDLLIGAQANFDLQEGEGGTPLFVASQQGRQQVVKALLKAAADTDVQSESGATPLLVATQFARETVVSSLINARADVNRAKCTGATPLYIAAQNGQNQLVKFFIDANADVNLKQEAGLSPLFVASQNGHHKVVSMIIGALADVDLVQNLGASPLYISSQNGHQQVVSLLIKAQSQVDIQRDNGCSSLYVASQNGHREIVNLLLKAGANPDLKDDCGRTPVFMATHEGYHNVVDLLIKAQADVSIPAGDGIVPIIAASLYGHEKVLDLLIKTPADVDAELEPGVSSLLIASLKGRHLAVDLLIKAKANIRVQLADGSSPMSVATESGHTKVVALLKQALIDDGWICEEIDVPESDGDLQAGSSSSEAPHQSAACDDEELSILLHSALSKSGFTQSRAALQSAVADVLQLILRKRLDNDEVHIVGSYSEGWGNNLKTLDGRTDIESDIDVMRLFASRLYHLKDLCKCKDPDGELMDYHNGHIFCPGFASNPAKAFRGSAAKPAVDKVDACRLCCYPPIAPLQPDRVSKSNISEAVLKALQKELDDSSCHVVHAAPPGKAGEQLRVSTTFLERRLLRSLTTLQGQLFVTLKYLVKKVITNKARFNVEGVKAYHVKTITFRMIEETSASQWKPENLVCLVRQAIQLLQDSMQNGCRQENADQRVMNHFFLGDAGLYLKGTGPLPPEKMHQILQHAAITLKEVLNQLPKLLVEFKDTLRPVSSSSIFYFHPFAILPYLETNPVPSGRIQYYEIYDVVRESLVLIGEQGCSVEAMERLTELVDKLPDCTCSTREALRALTLLKFGYREAAAETVRDCESLRVSRGISWPLERPPTEASPRLVWLHLTDQNSAWKFCFEFNQNAPKLNFLAEALANCFPMQTSNRNQFYMNFDLLLRVLQLELMDNPDLAAQDSFVQGIVEREDADPQELMVAYLKCRNSQTGQVISARILEVMKHVPRWLVAAVGLKFDFKV